MSPNTTTHCALCAAALALLATPLYASLIVAPTHDAFVVNTSPDDSFPTETRVLTWTSYMGGGRGRSYLMFPTDSFPALNLATSATLHLYQYDAGGFVPWVNIYHVSDDSWTQSTVTWNNRPLPLPTANELILRKNIGFDAGWTTFDLLAPAWDYNADLADGYLSLLIKSDESGDERHNFYSSDADDLLPYLEINYVPEPASLAFVALTAFALFTRHRSLHRPLPRRVATAPRRHLAP